MKLNTLPAAAAAAALALPLAVSQAAPRAESAAECGIAADMAVVAHSLAREEIQRQKADAIMVRIYDVSESDRGKELMRDIIDAAYSKYQDSNASAGGASSSQRFAEDLFATCIKGGGDMDAILGRRS
jgi:lipopolysaccharide export LptBFGC system permease protein LptF